MCAHGPMRRVRDPRTGLGNEAGGVADEGLRLRVLVTNDDGLLSTGLSVLAEAVRKVGHDVVVVAPRRNMSGSGTSVGHSTAGLSVEYRAESLPGASVQAFSVDAPPAQIGRAACRERV